MLAAEDQIKEAQEYYRAKLSLADLLGVNKKQKESFEKKRAKATKTALEIQTAKYVSAYLSASGGRAEIRVKATKQVDALPVYGALAAALKVKGLKTLEIVEAYGKETVKDLKRLNRNIVTLKGGASIGKLAVDFGYPSEGALIEALTAAPKRQDAIDARAKEILAEAEQGILDSLKQQELFPGEEALHNDASLQFLIAEMELLETKLD